MRCIICGAAHVSCGPVGTGTPVKPLTAPTRKGNTMADLAEYFVTMNGIETTAMLSLADAQRIGGRPVKAAMHAAPAAPAPEPEPEVKDRRSVPTMARTPQGKRR